MVYAAPMSCTQWAMVLALASLVPACSESRPAPAPERPMASEPVDEANLNFFNKLSAEVHVQLSQPTEKINPQMENRMAPAAAQLLGVSMEWQVFEDGAFRELRPDEWA